MYRLVVTGAFAVRNRGVVVTGRIVEGERPTSGTVVTISVDGKVTLSSVVAGRDFHYRPQPGEDRFLLRGVAKTDVPIGAGITTNSEPTDPEPPVSQ